MEDTRIPPMMVRTKVRASFRAVACLKQASSGFSDPPPSFLHSPERPPRSTAVMPYAAESMATTALREAKKIWPVLAGFSCMGYFAYSATSGAAAAVRRSSQSAAPPLARFRCGLRASSHRFLSD